MGHHKAIDLYRRMPDFFEQAFKFSIGRNPFDRLVSTYNFIRSRGTAHGWVKWYSEYDDPLMRNFDSFITSWLPKYGTESTGVLLQIQSSYLCNLKGEIMVDYVGKLENLEDIERRLSKQLNRAIEIPFVNVNENKIAKEVYFSDAMKAVVRDLYKLDFELLGYSV